MQNIGQKKYNTFKSIIESGTYISKWVNIVKW